MRRRLRLLLESNGSLARGEGAFVLPFEVDELPGIGTEEIDASEEAALAAAALALAEDDPPLLPPAVEAELVWADTHIAHVKKANRKGVTCFKHLICVPPGAARYVPNGPPCTDIVLLIATLGKLMRRRTIL
jgi:hypothetical protein